MPDVTQSKTFAPGPDASLTIDIDLVSQQAIAGLLKDYGTIVKLNDEKRKNTSYVIIDPDAVKHVLISNHGNYQKGTGFERVKMLLGNGIIVSDGEFWRRQRTMIQPAFSKKNILQLCDMIKMVSQRLIPKWKKLAETGEQIDITMETSEFSLEVILRAIISDDLDVIIAEQGENPFSFLANDPTRDLSVAMKFRQLGKYIQKIIDKRREQNIDAGDLLSGIMLAKDKNGEGMSDKELIDEVMTMIIAGHETSAGTLNWVWYELSRHPDSEAIAFQEADKYVHGDTLSNEDLPNLSFIKQCIDEALRLYPPVWLYSRKAINDDEILGFHVPAGSNIFLSPYFTHREAVLWDKPNDFYPNHFIDDGAHLKHKYAFIPFSAGSRRCIGEYLSYIEMQIHISILLKTFKLDLVPDQTVEIEPAINLRTKNSIMMQISLR